MRTLTCFRVESEKSVPMANVLNLQITHACVIVVPDGLEADGKTDEGLMGNESTSEMFPKYSADKSGAMAMWPAAYVYLWWRLERERWVQGKHIGVFFNRINIDFFS